MKERRKSETIRDRGEVFLSYVYLLEINRKYIINYNSHLMHNFTPMHQSVFFYK